MGKTGNLFAAVLLFALLAASSNAQGQERLKLAYSAPSGAMLTPWVALEAGIFKKNNLAVELVYIAGGSVTAAALVGGDIQSMLANGEVVLRGRLQGSDLISLPRRASPP